MKEMFVLYHLQILIQKILFISWFICLDNVNPIKIDIISLCGFGGLFISRAYMDSHIKDTVSVTIGSFDDHINNSRIAEIIWIKI